MTIAAPAVFVDSARGTHGTSMAPGLKVISGGQTGVDQAALRAAKQAGLPTGGWLPNGCLTHEGVCEELLSIYGMSEHPDAGYPPRTDANVEQSDATIRIARNFTSPGEQCTLRAIHRHNKPHLDISWRPSYGPDKMPTPDGVVGWLEEHAVRTLNVAGNSERSAPGIGDGAHPFLLSVFLLWKERCDDQQ